MIKDFPNNVLKTLAIGRNAAAIISSSTFSDTLLFRGGTTDSPVGNIRVLDAPRGLDGSHFRELASKEHPPGAQHITDNSREAQMAARIADLMAQVTEVSNPRQEHQGREKWNSDDVGPPLNAEALVGGKGPLDRQKAPPSQVELKTGATRALTERLPLRPFTGAWEVGETN